MPHNEERGASEEDDEGSRGTANAPDSLIVVSNRQPYRHEYADGDDGAASTDGSISVDRPTGGLTAGLDPVLREAGGTWIAWGDGDADREVTDDDGRVSVPPEEGDYTLQRLWLSDEAVDGYYYGYSNRVLWPLCHGLVDLIEDRPGDREWYRAVNAQFADAVCEHATDGSVVWLQDYHLGLAPAMIRERVPEGVTLAQFWHIPWPSPAAFEGRSDGPELLRGLLGNDLLGFHVERYRDAFVETVDRFVPEARVDRRRNAIQHGAGETRVVADPMGVDAAEYARQSRAVDDDRWTALREEYGVPPDVSVGLGLDRLDYSKGIPERLAAIERLFERRPDWRGEFTFVQKATPSRTDIPAYARHGERVRSEVDRINGRFATREWSPIVYTEDVLPREDLCSLYRNADVMVVSSLRDGMNLVAQEYVAASVDASGALVLSEDAGAHDHLGEAAYSIDPRATDEFAATIERALAAPRGDRRRRMSRLRRRVFERDLDAWMASQFAAIDAVGSEPEREGPNEPFQSI